jgi:hypothetical protein
MNRNRDFDHGNMNRGSMGGSGSFGRSNQNDWNNNRNSGRNEMQNWGSDYGNAGQSNFGNQGLGGWQSGSGYGSSDYTGAQIMTEEITQVPEAVLGMKAQAGKVERTLRACRVATEEKDQRI